MIRACRPPAAPAVFSLRSKRANSAEPTSGGVCQDRDESSSRTSCSRAPDAHAFPIQLIRHAHGGSGGWITRLAASSFGSAHDPSPALQCSLFFDRHRHGSEPCRGHHQGARSAEGQLGDFRSRSRSAQGHLRQIRSQARDALHFGWRRDHAGAHFRQCRHCDLDRDHGHPEHVRKGRANSSHRRVHDPAPTISSGMCLLPPRFIR